jgi:KDO2-lipid IV(A) lauroyltransferase
MSSSDRDGPADAPTPGPVRREPFIVRVFRWLSTLPLPVLHGIGVVVGWITFLSSKRYRERFLANARQAGMTPAQWRPAVAEAGKLVMEVPYLWMRTGPVTPTVHWQGMANVEAAHAHGRGIVFLTPHLGSFEVTAQAYAEVFGPLGKPITVLYRPARKAWLRELVDTSRVRPYLAAAPATLAGVRQMIRALRRGEAVGLLPDQVPPDGLGTWAPFFGMPAYTMTLAARLVQLTGAAPMLAWGERLPRGKGYILHMIVPPESLLVNVNLGLSDEAAQAECAAAVNRCMESLIRRAPAQYLWGYHRYKTPPSGGIRARE